MHPLLQTLDFTTGAGTESSVHDLHPIQSAASGRSRTLPALLSLGLTLVLIYGLSLSLVSPLSTISSLIGVGSRSVTLTLDDSEGRFNLPAPTPTPRGLQGPGGAGHREGTSTLDPRLALLPHPLLALPTEAIDPDELSTSARADPATLSLNPALPLQTGGNGLARGPGRDAALGRGGLMGPLGLAAVPDRQLIPTRQATIEYRLAPGEASSLGPVRVRILIGEEGIPTDASIVSCPPYLVERALKAAREWRFEPLGAHGLKAPLSLMLVFHPRLLSPR